MFIKAIFAILALAITSEAMASGSNQASGNSSATASESKAISIIGNSELPEVEVILPWRVAEGSRRSDSELQMVEMPDAGKPVGLESHRRQVFFDKHLKLQPQGFEKP